MKPLNHYNSTSWPDILITMQKRGRAGSEWPLQNATIKISRQLTEQLLHGLSDDDIMIEILK